VTPVPAPSPAAGLYIKTRGGELTQVRIPPDCLAFQTGEALELATAGKLRATPHCVRAGGGGPGAERISRETFGQLQCFCSVVDLPDILPALFMQADTDMLVGENETFGHFSKRIFEEHYGKNGGM
jgi:isopenicillin N synthase-like dioxygenase